MENFCQIGKLEKKHGYDVCRGEKRRGDLRYDLTLLYPKTSTFGHFHTKGHAELFEVLSGQAMFFMQRHGKLPKFVKEAYLVEAKKNEKIIVLPNFSITTINPKKNKKLIVSNWINNKVKNDYSIFKKLKGPCYKKAGKEFEKNKNYKKIPNLIRLRPKKLPAKLKNLNFLNNPKKYKKILTIKNLYTKI
ncbi:MAG: glucose-6-phosphate isomerase family protein [Candidatus Tagabacteria bacterium]